jgi:hypothetical protein
MQMLSRSPPPGGSRWSRRWWGKRHRLGRSQPRPARRQGRTGRTGPRYRTARQKHCLKACDNTSVTICNDDTRRRVDARLIGPDPPFSLRVRRYGSSDQRKQSNLDMLSLTHVQFVLENVGNRCSINENPEHGARAVSRHVTGTLTKTCPA